MTAEADQTLPEVLLEAGSPAWLVAMGEALIADAGHADKTPADDTENGGFGCVSTIENNGARAAGEAERVLPSGLRMPTPQGTASNRSSVCCAPRIAPTGRGSCDRERIQREPGATQRGALRPGAEHVG